MSTITACGNNVKELPGVPTPEARRNGGGALTLGPFDDVVVGMALAVASPDPSEPVAAIAHPRAAAGEQVRRRDFELERVGDPVDQAERERDLGKLADRLVAYPAWLRRSRWPGVIVSGPLSSDGLRGLFLPQERQDTLGKHLRDEDIRDVLLALDDQDARVGQRTRHRFDVVPQEVWAF